MPGHVPADPALLAEGRRRALLTRLLSSGGYARVTNPDHPDGGWEGKVVGLVDWPSVVIEGGEGRRWTVPQHFAIEEISGDEAAEAAEDRVIERLADWERELLLEDATAKLATAEAKLAKVRNLGDAWAKLAPFGVHSALASCGRALLANLDGPEPGLAVSQAPPRPTAAETALSQAKAALHRLACAEDMARPNMTEREGRCAYALEALDLIGRIESETGENPAVSRFTPAEGHGCQHPEASNG